MANISKIDTRPLIKSNGDPKWIVFVNILSPWSRLISLLAGLWVPFLKVNGGVKRGVVKPKWGVTVN